ncbi:hypothetical protein D046_4937A, partial [Vibrio parahaemolyticus V-223/04]
MLGLCDLVKVTQHL